MKIDYSVGYRSPVQEDLPFIMATWLHGQRHQGDRAFMTNKVYFDNEKRRIERVLAGAKVAVICNPEDSRHVFGYLAYNLVSDLFIIHYAHVKKPYRSLGIMRTLIKGLYPDLGKDEIGITHINEEVALKREAYKLRYNPYLGGYL